MKKKYKDTEDMKMEHRDTADTDLLKKVPVKILLNFERKKKLYITIRILKISFRNCVHTIGPFDLTEAQSFLSRSKINRNPLNSAMEREIRTNISILMIEEAIEKKSNKGWYK